MRLYLLYHTIILYDTLLYNYTFTEIGSELSIIISMSWVLVIICNKLKWFNYIECEPTVTQKIVTAT